MGGQSMLIQLILLLSVGVVAALLTRSTAGARHQAIRRLALLAFVLAAVLSIVFPVWLSRAANLVGVGRGTDLLLYGLVIAFLSYIATSHRRMNQMSRSITLLTRELTLSEARSAHLGEHGCAAAPGEPSSSASSASKSVSASAPASAPSSTPPPPS